MAIKYDLETLDKALACCSPGNTLELRKQGEKILRQAACLELGTKNTLPVREWFISHTDELITIVSSEKDSQLLWGYIYMLQSFCQRYMKEWYLVRNSEEFIADERTVAFRIKTWNIIDTMVTYPDLKVLQAIGSFLSIYGDSRAWDIFAIVLKKKRDKLTLSHITIAIARCKNILLNNLEITDYRDKPVEHDKIISEKQVEVLLDLFATILERTSTAKYTCEKTIKNLNDIHQSIVVK